jgi:hypothetical protein
MQRLRIYASPTVEAAASRAYRAAGYVQLKASIGETDDDDFPRWEAEYGAATVELLAAIQNDLGTPADVDTAEITR